MKSRIYLSPPHMSGLEMQYINEAFSTNWIAPIGPNVDAFEKELASYLGVKHVAAVSSGTAAIHLALINLGIGQGDEVVVPSLTFSATVNPIIYQNATPVCIDSEKESWNMCPILLKEALEDRKKNGKLPKAIILVHIYGMPAKIEEIQKIATEYNIPIIEDAAESLGSKYKNKHTGTFGSMGVLSFNGNKIITTSGGGALISDNEQFISHARFLATQARDQVPYYQHSQIGYNYRMSNVLAGIGRGQLEVIDMRVSSRRSNFDFYSMLFSEIDGISFCNEPENSHSNRWLTCIQIDPNTCGKKTPALLMEAFEKDNIESRHIWKPMHLQPVFAKCPAYVNGTAQKIFETGLCLPSGTSLSDEELDRIGDVIRDFFKS